MADSIQRLKFLGSGPFTAASQPTEIFLKECTFTKSSFAANKRKVVHRSLGPQGQAGSTMLLQDTAGLCE